MKNKNLSLIERPQPQQLTIDQALHLAIQHHQAGRLKEAESFYRSILAVQPKHAWANHNIGMLASQVGNQDAAIMHLKIAVNSAPSQSMFANDYGYSLANSGNIDAAKKVFYKLLESANTDIGALNGVAVCLLHSRELQSCKEWLEKAITIHPENPNLRTNFGECLQRMGLYGDAVSVLERVTNENPGFTDAIVNLGVSLRKSGDTAGAIDVLSKVVEENKNHAVALAALAAALLDLDKLDESENYYNNSLKINSNNYEAVNGLGAVLAKQGRLDEADTILRKALTIKPDYVDAMVNLGSTLHQQERLDESETILRKALTIKPDHQEATWMLSCNSLIKGNFEEGLNLHDSRFRVKQHKNPLRFEGAIWRGEPVEGKTILIWAEQGLGDQIQMLRYIPMVKAMGAHVIVETNQELHRLCKDISGVDNFVIRGEQEPIFDVHCPVMSLPCAFKTTVDTIPRSVPYLEPSADLVSEWRNRLQDTKGLRVGLVWAGNPIHKNDHNRSIELEQFSPLADNRFSLVSIQKGHGESQVTACTFPIIHLGNEIKDFSDTAAIIANLDLTITVDTSVAHLAGAMGKPIWVLLPTAPDWRWMLHMEDSPWYPSMRLFRQQTRGDWAAVIDSVAKQLAAKLQ
jgi:tetratricopeptide (TPR) repeat protein